MTKESASENSDSVRGGEPVPGVWAPTAHGLHSSVEEARTTARKAAGHLLSLQHREGYWVGDLTADSTLQSDYILLQMWLYPPEQDGAWNPPTMPRIRKAVQAILTAQRPD